MVTEFALCGTMALTKVGDFMFYNAKNGSIPIGDTHMDYIAFGSGNRNLVMIPGLGEALQSIKGTALPFALMYRKLAKRYRVTVFARREQLPESFSTRNMAADIHYGMEHLGISSACVIGVSLGGMIAQHLAIDHPHRVEKLILTVTLPRQNPTLRSTLTQWMEMARQGDIPGIMADTALKSYTPAKCTKPLMWSYRLIGRMIKRSKTTRFLTMSEAGLQHDAYHRLHEITCPTLIIGGSLDEIVDGSASEEMHRLIPHSRLYMYEQYGHGLYEEAPDFIDRIIEFFQ